jgi:4-azaleucine resistance transporter AzlC
MPAEVLSDTPASSRRHRLLRGARLGLPIFLGYMPVGAAFGILARTAGFTLTQAVACSGLVLAGAGQFVGLSLMRANADIAAILIATGVINLRYVLFGAAVSPYLRTTPLPMQASLAFSLTDETFAVNIADQQAGTADELSMTGVGAISWMGWVGGTVAGAALGGLVGDPARWGVGFAMPAMFTALLVGQAVDRRHVLVGAVAAVLALAFAAVLPGTWFVVVAAIGAASVGAVVYR